jgi:hypothetical protein
LGSTPSQCVGEDAVDGEVLPPAATTEVALGEIARHLDVAESRGIDLIGRPQRDLLAPIERPRSRKTEAVYAARIERTRSKMPAYVTSAVKVNISAS